MKTRFILPFLFGLGGCSLVLEDPAPFVVTTDASTEDAVVDAGEPDAGPRPLPDARPRPDIGPAPDAAPDPDAEPPDMMIEADAEPPDMMAEADMSAPDVEPPDEGGADAEAPDMRPMDDAMPPPCIPVEERCNGEDDDCDEVVDEDDPSICTPCGFDEGEGVCGFGALDCAEGELVCTRWLPPAEAVVPCDLIDNDCDGNVDEAEEGAPERTPEEEALYDRCGADPRTAAPTPEAPCSVDPRVVGCELAHACVPADCRVRCEGTRAPTGAACIAQCPAEPPLARTNCISGCRDAVETAYRLCLEACNDAPEARYTCEDGPVCAPLE